jgi:hypothetical protein
MFYNAILGGKVLKWDHGGGGGRKLETGVIRSLHSSKP